MFQPTAHAFAAAVPPLPLGGVIFNWAMSGWIIVLCTLVAAVLVVYLYQAQQKIASRKAVRWLTGIRFTLILLTFLLLAGAGWQRSRTGKSGGTLWLVVDQSGSMGQADKQATPVEKLRWADALGLLPADVRPDKLDRRAAEVQSLRADLAFHRTRGEVAVDAADAAKAKSDYVSALADWRKKLAAAADGIEGDPAMKTADGAAAVRSLRDTAAAMAAALDKAGDKSTREAVAAALPWADALAKLDAALAVVRLAANTADEKFVAEKGATPAVAEALDKVSAMTRAQLAAATISGKSRNGGTSVQDLVPRQTTKIVAFGDAPQLVEVKDADALPKALKDLPATGKSTNVAGALQFIAQQLGQDEPASVVVWSDGRQNVGGDLVEPSRALAARGVRVFTLGLGSEKVAPDAAIEQVDAPDWIFKDDTLRASALLRLDGLNGKPVKVEFRRGQTLLESETKTVTPTQDRDTKVVTFNDKPPEPGVFEYSVRVVPLDEEAVKENNAQSMRVSVKKDKLNVLIVEDQPRWEYRYLANYLQRDQRVKLQTILLQPALIADVGRGEARKASPKNDRTEADVLPEKKEEWAAFDMIVIGDVPKERLGEEAQKNIVSAVKDRGATVLLIAGLFNMPQRFGGTPLQELLPVDLTSGGEWGTDEIAKHLKNGFKPTIAPEGVNSVLSQFTVDESSNNAIWNAMPAWYWHSEYTHVRAANVIWSIEDYKKGDAAAGAPAAAPAGANAANANDAEANTLERVRKRALLSTSGVGMGRVMYLASDQTWRLRQVNGMNLHERLWGQVIRWVVGNDRPAGGKFVQFGSNKPRYVAGEQVVVTGRLLGEDFAPLQGQNVKVIARLAAGKDPKTGLPAGDMKQVGEATLVEVADAPGFYRASLGGLPAGAIELSLQGNRVEELLTKDETVISKALHVDVASQADVEQRNINPDRPALAGIARAGGGVALDAAYADVLAAHVPALSYTTERVEQYGLFADPKDKNTLWVHWVFLGLFVVLVSAEWIIRKSVGLV